MHILHGTYLCLTHAYMNYPSLCTMHHRNGLLVYANCMQLIYFFCHSNVRPFDSYPKPAIIFQQISVSRKQQCVVNPSKWHCYPVNAVSVNCQWVPGGFDNNQCGSLHFRWQIFSGGGNAKRCYFFVMDHLRVASTMRPRRNDHHFVFHNFKLFSPHCSRWSLRMDKQFLSILYNVCHYTSIVGLKSIGKRDPSCQQQSWVLTGGYFLNEDVVVLEISLDIFFLVDRSTIR